MISIDTLVHLGAGQCSELDEYLALQPRQLFLVEADPRLAKELQSRTEDLKQAQVICVAVAGQPGPATFHRYNLPEVNSLHRASSLLELFPGLKILDQMQVESVSPVMLLQSWQLQAERKNRLVIDLPGEELPVLKTLQQAQKLYIFEQVDLHCGRKPLYEGSEPAVQVLSWFQEEGYDLVAEDHSRDPDRPTWTFQRNALKLRNRDLQKQVDELQNKLEQTSRKNVALAHQANEIHPQVQHLMQKRDVQAKLVAECQQQVLKLTQAHDQRINLDGKKQAQVKQLTKANNNQVRLSRYRQLQSQDYTNTIENPNKPSVIYNKAFYDNQKRGSENSARIVLPLVFRYFFPRSLIDVGCGVGTWLNIANSLGVVEIKGIDGNYAVNELIIPKEVFLPIDINHAIPPLGKYDLAICLEVAEHLEKERAKSFVDDLCSLSDIILFSAAIPYQGGTKHLNENWIEFWVNKFETKKYQPVDYLRNMIWDCPEVEWWYKQNIMLFVKHELLYKVNFPAKTYDSQSRFSMIHPELYLRTVHKRNFPGKPSLVFDLMDYEATVKKYKEHV